ncbi:MAG: hydrogenase maturation nickel metallochaperone HypA [Candidatus Limnocylindrales bacterium]
MHQVALAQAALDKVVARAAELGVDRVSAVHLHLGEDDDHTEEALRFAWAEVSSGTCAQDAELVFEKVPGDGVRLAAMDVQREPATPAKRPTKDGGAIG